MPLPKVLRTKIIPPRRSARTLYRPRLQSALLESVNYRLTILQAAAGYGKSTALAALEDEFEPIIWYTATVEDADPLVFLLHLCHAIRVAFPGVPGLPTGYLEAWDVTRGPLPAAGIIDEINNALGEYLPGPTLFVLDDAHLILSTDSGSDDTALLLDRLIGMSPPDLHFLLAARPPAQLPNLPFWQAKGQALILDQSVLAFTPPEILALFIQQYHYELTPDEAERLFAASEGWAIAIQLMWQNLRSGSAALVEGAWLHPPGSLKGLFDILASEVFSRQPSDVQEFLLVSSTLRELSPEACDALRGACDSAALLSYLRRQELFVVDIGEANEAARKPLHTISSNLKLRYHIIFHDYLAHSAALSVPAGQRREWHQRCADFYKAREDWDSAIYHLLNADDLEGAAALLEQYGTELLAAGRLDTLAAHLDELPPETLRGHPALLFYLGDLARLHSRFQEALGWYQQSEAIWRERGQVDGISRALRGQARVYLDTVDPSRAEELLEQVTRLTDGYDDRESQARLYELLAENKLNAGKVEAAERLVQQAERLRNEGPSHSQLKYRVLLRTGRLQEARHELEACAEAEHQHPVATPRAHRETQLLLSLVYAFMGEAQEAYAAALEGTQRGVDLHSPFITAVGHMRQGHALMLLASDWNSGFLRGPLKEMLADSQGTVHTSAISSLEYYSRARAQFEKTIQLGQTLSVSRLAVEARWGLCRAFGYGGDLAQAQAAAQAALEVAVQAGDEWIASLVRLAMGASFTLASRYEAAEEWLSRAALSFQECSDIFGLCAARLWLCLAWFRQHNDLSLSQTLPWVLTTCLQNGYDFLFTRPTLLGPPSERAFIPLLILAGERGYEAGYASRLLEASGLAQLKLHPGYQLRVKTLGGFNVWRGDTPVPQNGWNREKARQLFQLLVTFRHAPLDRDQIAEYLWPNLDPATLQRNFKVALNALYHVLEPDREAGRESAYIIREGTVYSLRPGADLWIDAEIFNEKIGQAEAMLNSQPDLAMHFMEEAISLYDGEYLPDARYETWAAIEREHLAVRFLRAADRLSEGLLEQNRFPEMIQVCQHILSVDNCWERAYQRLMLGYDHLGDHGQVARTYQRCITTLRSELDVTPAPETEGLYLKLTQAKS